MKIEGQLIMELMRSCLTELSNTLENLRQESGEAAPEAFPVMRNGLLFSLDMSLAVIHMVGVKLSQAEQTGGVELEDSERVVVGMAATLMPESVAALVDDALEGLPVSDDRVRSVLGEEGDSEESETPSIH